MLDFFKKLVPLLPDGVFAWDDSSNNKALISGQSALIMNPPSAWAVAVRDAPKVAEQCWHFPSPKGPKGRFDPAQPSYWGIWNFSPNKSAGKSLLLHLWEKGSVEQLVAGSKGYDIPAFRNLARLQDLGRGGSAKGRHLELPAARRCDRVGVRLAGADADRQSDLRAGDDDQDDRPVHAAGKDHGPGDGLGRRRARRLQPFARTRAAGDDTAAVDGPAARTYSLTPQNGRRRRWRCGRKRCRDRVPTISWRCSTRRPSIGAIGYLSSCSRRCSSSNFSIFSSSAICWRCWRRSGTSPTANRR